MHKYKLHMHIAAKIHRVWLKCILYKVKLNILRICMLMFSLERLLFYVRIRVACSDNVMQWPSPTVHRGPRRVHSILLKQKSITTPGREVFHSFLFPSKMSPAVASSQTMQRSYKKGVQVHHRICGRCS